MILEAVVGWQYSALGDICDVRDGTHDSPKYVEDGYPLITSKNLSANGLCFEKISYITKEDHDEIEKRSAVSDGDILYGMIGTIGNPVIVRKDRDFSVKNVAVFKFLEDSLIFNKYLFYVLNSVFVTRQISKESKGGTQKFVSLKVLRGLKIPLPPLKTQKKIVAVLEKADQLRKNCQQMEQELNSLAQSVFIDMFGDPVTNPKGWNIAPLSSLGKVSGGLSVTSKRSINPISVPYLRVANVYRDYLKLDEVKDIRVTSKELEKVLLEKGDVLFVEGHGNANEVGRAAVWNNEIAQCVHQNHLIRFRAEKDIRPEYVSAFVNSTSGRRQLLKMSKTTSGLNTLSTSNIKSIQIIVPPLPQQDKYLNFIDCWTKQKNSNSRLSAEFNEQFNALMQKAFKGELNV